MILFKRGNLLDSNSYIICNTVNCVGVMGAGVAKDFKAKYPEYFKWYKSECLMGNILPGNCYYYLHINSYNLLTFDENSDRIILSLSTKNHWKNPSKYEWVESCLINLNNNIESLMKTNYKHPKTVALPILGCGNGQLDKHKVKTLITNILTYDCTFEIWEKII